MLAVRSFIALGDSFTEGVGDPYPDGSHRGWAHNCLHVDLWSMRVLADPREWCEDRLHLAPDGHRRVALRACDVAGISVSGDWREPLPADPPDLQPL